MTKIIGLLLIVALISLSASTLTAAKEISEDEWKLMDIDQATTDVQNQREEACLGYSGDEDCCKSLQQCALGEGDCTRDDDCVSYLVCGRMNCRNDPAFMGGYLERMRSGYEINFSLADDCCTLPEELLPIYRDQVE